MEFFLFSDRELTVQVLGVVVILILPMNYLDFHFYGFGSEYFLATTAELILLMFTIITIISIRKTNQVGVYQSWVFAWELFTALLAAAIILGQPVRATENILFSILFLIANFILIPNRIWHRLIPAIIVNAACGYVLLATDWIAFDNQYMLFWIIISIDAAGLLLISRGNQIKRLAYEIHKNERQARRLFETLATTDELTSVLNRRGFFDQAEREFSRHVRHRTELCLAVIDLDYFKRVNDQFGHQAGDETLRHFASTVNSIKRSYDILGRLGGEEFGLVLPDTSLKDAEKVVARMQLAVRKTTIVSGVSRFSYTVSVGLTAASRDDGSFDDLHRRADALLYRAKAEGRDRIEAGV
jgi:diguanylate cyclase (GGDEF)-like protein